MSQNESKTTLPKALEGESDLVSMTAFSRVVFAADFGLSRRGCFTIEMRRGLAAKQTLLKLKLRHVCRGRPLYKSCYKSQNGRG
jgi:hypothetical protein